MNEPTAHRPVPVDIHHPTPITGTHTAPLVPVQPDTVPTVASIVLPDGRIVTGYAIEPTKTAPATAKPAVSRTALNVALGGIGFLAVSCGLLMLTTFIAALAALIQQLIILAAVIFGGWIAVQVLGNRDTSGGTTVNIRKAVIKRNHFHR
ncbi:hypothetical protein AB0P17_04115 [Streptomyces sp. NPDC088124]|uniref:hypothetical protein n=1 Tax=Streptomyces sp. NPDC088124 TaxID=3154654 RepID=UPI00342D9759